MVNPELSQKELDHCDKPLDPDWENEFEYAGGFQSYLMEAISRADEVNLKKISTVYPNLVKLYKIWRDQK